MFDCIPHISHHRHHLQWCVFFQAAGFGCRCFFCTEYAKYWLFWPILDILSQFYALLVPFFHAYIVQWCPKIDKYQVCFIATGSGSDRACWVRTSIQDQTMREFSIRRRKVWKSKMLKWSKGPSFGLHIQNLKHIIARFSVLTGLLGSPHPFQR